VAAALLLLRPFDLILRLLFQCRAVSEYDIEEAHKVANFKYPYFYGVHCIVFLITLVYSSIAPIILPFSILYFACSYICLTHNLLFVHTPEYKGSGLIIGTVFSVCCIIIVLYQLIMLALLGILGFIPAPVLVPLPIFTLAYWYWHHSRSASLPYRVRAYGTLLDSRFPPQIGNHYRRGNSNIAIPFLRKFSEDGDDIDSDNSENSEKSVSNNTQEDNNDEFATYLSTKDLTNAYVHPKTVIVPLNEFLAKMDSHSHTRTRTSSSYSDEERMENKTKAKRGVHQKSSSEEEGNSSSKV